MIFHFYLKLWAKSYETEKQKLGIKFPSSLLPQNNLIPFSPEGEGSLIPFFLKEKTIFFPQGIYFEEVTQRFFFSSILFMEEKEKLIKKIEP